MSIGKDTEEPADGAGSGAPLDGVTYVVQKATTILGMTSKLRSLSILPWDDLEEWYDVSDIICAIKRAEHLRLLSLKGVRVSIDVLAGALEIARGLTAIELYEKTDPAVRCARTLGAQTLQVLDIYPDYEEDPDYEEIEEYEGPMCGLADDQLIRIIARVRKLKKLRLRYCSLLGQIRQKPRAD